MKKRFLNRSEEITYEKLRAICEPLGAHVFAKARISDVLPVEGSGVSDLEFGFSLKSHFDFVVTDSDHMPEFSVEFDGPTHRNDRQKARDTLKNQLCDRFEYPLLRINARYLDKKFRDYDLLTYFVDVWYHGKAFFEAQEKGLVPTDEPFDPASIVYDGRPDSKYWPLWLSYDHQRTIKRWFEEGLVAQPGLSHWVGKDSNGNYHCIAWIHLLNGKAMVVKTGMREQRFPFVDPSDVLETISIFNLCEELEDYFRGRRRPVPLENFGEQLKHFQQEFHIWSSSTCGLGDPRGSFQN